MRGARLVQVKICFSCIETLTTFPTTFVISCRYNTNLSHLMLFAASNAQMMAILNQAMNQWTSQTCIRFQQRKSENGYA